MFTQLKSKYFRVQINAHGAEINSVKDNNDVEFIWQAEKEIWARHAPVLFPIVGKLKNDCYFFQGQSYHLSQHGFARDASFELVQHSESICLYEFRSNLETKKKYPFDFIFQIQYQLIEDTLTTEYKVINPSTETIYFSVGAHPGFNCPLLKDETFEDYSLVFESSKYNLTELNDGLRKESKTELNLDDNNLPLSSNLFDNDALVFENSQINKISLVSKKSKHSIILNCQNWPFFGIWSKKSCQKFLCLEPWFGIADKENSSQDFLQKDGLIKLEPKKEFKCSFSITFK